MNNIKFKTVALIAGVGLLSSCGENAWNDRLDGFKEPPIYSKVETIEYTLTAADYKTIASNKTNKSLAEEKGLSEALAAVGNGACFTSAEEARLFIPAFIADPNFPYFTLNDGSSIKITYDLASNQPENVIAINNGVQTYKVNEANYQEAWGSDEAFINAFAPAAPASASIPEILKAQYPSAEKGQYAVVTYNESATNPDFGSADNAPKVYLDETFETGQGDFTIENTNIPADLSFVWSFAAGYGMKASAFANKTNYDAESWLISPEMKLGQNANAVVSFDQALNFFSSIDVAAQEATINVREAGGSWTTLTVPTMPEKLSWSFVASGEIDLSAYNGKTIQIGFCYKSTAAKSGTWEVKNVRVADNVQTKAATRADANVMTEEKNALYLFNGSEWSVPSSMLILQPADYTAMGQNYGNLSGSYPEQFLPIYLNQTLPYASDDAATVVVYKYYDGSSTSYRASQFTKTEGSWVINKGATIDKFTRKDGNWAFNPSVELVLPYSRNTEPSYSYYMACKDWVFDNVTLKLYPDASPANGSQPGPPFIDYRNNAEFYSGASAYYGNVDVRASTALSNAPAGYTGYEGLSDEQVSELIKKRFCTETFPGALSIMHPDANVVEGMDVTYTFTFTAYESGSGAVEHTMVYKVVGAGKFEFVSCDWWANGKPTE